VPVQSTATDERRHTAVVIAMMKGVGAAIRRRNSSGSTDLRVEGDRLPSSAPPAKATSVEVLEVRDVLRVEILGPVRITPVEDGLREFGRSLVCYLSLHADRPRSIDDVQTALWPVVGPHGDVTRKTFLNHVSAVRRSIGPHLPGSKGVARYALVNASLDWEEFRLLLDELPEASGTRTERLDQALELVRGVPFESEVGPVFQWSDTEGIRTSIARAVVAAATELHSMRVRTSDLAGAERALRQGLRCSPYEPSLWELLANVVEAKGDPGDELRFWHDALSILDEVALRRLLDRVHE
jgi:DNA-binding SARP family transcriptional activator